MLTKYSYLLGILCCFLATAAWGVMYVVLGFALQYVDPINITVIRFIITAVMFIILLVIFEGLKTFKMSVKELLLVFLVGSFGFSGTAFLTIIAQNIIGSEGAVAVAIILSTSPMVSLLVVWLLKSQRPSFFSFCCIIMSFIGVVLVVTKGHLGVLIDSHAHPWANLLIFVAVLNFVLYSMASQLFKGWSALKYTATTTIMGAITLTLIGTVINFLGLVHFPTINAVVKILPHMVYVAAVATCGGLLMWNYGTKIVGASNAMPFMNITPIVALIGSIFLGVIPTMVQIIGIMITVLALITYNIYQRMKLKKV